MKMKQQLTFVPPTTEAFLDFLCPLWHTGIRNIQLVGNNELARQLAAEIAKKDLVVESVPIANSSNIANSQVTVFTEMQPELLSAQLMVCVDVPDIIVLAPLTDRHFSKNPLFLISIPKAGTHLLFELAKALGYHAGVEAPAFPHPQTWYCLEYSNPHTVARDFFVDTVRRSAFGNRHHIFSRTPALFIYRHPLDILVSETNYYHQDGKTAFFGYLSQFSFTERIERLMNDPWMLGSLRQRVGGFMPWLFFPNVVPISFEELVGEKGGGDRQAQHLLIWSLQLKLQVPGVTEDICARVFNPDSPTFRKGQTGRYRADLAPKAVSSFVRENQDILGAFGYPSDGSPGPTTKAEDRRKAPLSFSAVDYHTMPITIESDFLGCNLVRYNHCFVAVPLAAGPMAIDQLPLELLNELPTATTLWELKILLLTGAVSTARHRVALDQLAQALKKERSTDNVHSYWYHSQHPKSIEEHQGFRIIFFRGMYIGIHSSLYGARFDEHFHDWVKGAENDKVMVATSREDLLADIDGISTARRGKREKEEFNEKVERISKAFYFYEQSIELNKRKWTHEKKTLEIKIKELQSEIESIHKQLKQTEAILDDLYANSKN